MDARFRHHWEQWHALLRKGKTPADFLAECSDETLVELLAYKDEGSALERNVIATELTNRISRLHRAVEGHSDRLRDLLNRNERLRELGASVHAKQATADRLKAGESDRAIREDIDTFQADTEKTSRYSRRRHEGGW